MLGFDCITIVFCIVDVYDDLVLYVQYAFSAYASTCPSPNGNTLITEVGKRRYSSVFGRSVDLIVLQQFGDNLTDTQGFIARDDTRQEVVVSLRGR